MEGFAPNVSFHANAPYDSQEKNETWVNSYNNFILYNSVKVRIYLIQITQITLVFYTHITLVFCTHITRFIIIYTVLDNKVIHSLSAVPLVIFSTVLRYEIRHFKDWSRLISHFTLRVETVWWEFGPTATPFQRKKWNFVTDHDFLCSVICVLYLCISEFMRFAKPLETLCVQRKLCNCKRLRFVPYVNQ